MRRVACAAGGVLFLLSCTSTERLAPSMDQLAIESATSLPDIRISEIHYDNTGIDANEAIEVSGPAGTDLTGWTIVLYNGNGGPAYDTRPLPTPVPATCGDRGVVVINYPVNGIQNGPPDGMALVSPTGVVEFLSYEGTFTAVGGPANGLTSVDIGVSEVGTEPLGQSLQRSGNDSWSEPKASNFGACNDNVVTPPPPPPPPPPPLPETRFTELHYDNFDTDVGEAIEIEGPAGSDLASWKVVLYNGNGGVVYDTRTLSGAIPNQCTGRGVVMLAYLSNGIQNGSPDGMALVNADNVVIEFLSYEGTFTAADGPAQGMTSTDIGVSQAATPLGQTLQRDAAGVWSGPSATSGQSLGGCNSAGPLPFRIVTLTGREPAPTDPPLPVGFQDQLFATLRDASGTALPTTWTWTSETPDVASIDPDGVFTALSPGTAVLRATAADGTTNTVALTTRVAVLGSANYANNAEFGVPTDNDPSDDFIIRHDEFTASYNRLKGEPNWVSYDLDASHFGLEDRCDCFTADPALPPDFPHFTTNDYTGSGAIAGYGIDRGHLVRSFDRTSGSLDNAFTFYLSNIIPQAADLNQGPWAQFENYLGDRARFDTREVYIIAGGAGNKGTLKNEGKIVIPASMWKVAIILPLDQGLADVGSFQDVEVVAVIMPNDPGIRNVPWQSYTTTVNAVEALSGYDLLALLSDRIEIAVESNARQELSDARVLVDQLVAAHALDLADAKWIHNKLDIATKLLDQADVAAVVNQLREVLHRLADGGPGVAPLATAMQRFIQSLTLLE